MRLLVIDSSKTACARTAAGLQGAFEAATLIEVGSSEALEPALDAGDWDLVVLGERLAWADGDAVLARVRSRRPGAPVVLLTDRDDGAAAEAATRLGVDDYALRAQPGRLVFAVRQGLVRAGVLSCCERMEARRARSEGRADAAVTLLEELVAALPVGVALVRGPAHRYVWGNAAYRSLVGVTDETLTGRTVDDVFPSLGSEAAGNLLSRVEGSGQRVTVRVCPAPEEPHLDEVCWDVDVVPLRGLAVGGEAWAMGVALQAQIAGADTADVAADTADVGADTADVGADTAVAGADTAVAGADTAVAGADTAVAGADTAVAGADTAVAGADTAVAGADTADAGADTADAGADTAVANANGASASTDGASARTDTAAAGVAAGPNGGALPDAGAAPGSAASPEAGPAPGALIIAHRVIGPSRMGRQLGELASKLVEERRFLATVLENAPVPITYVDRDLIYRQCNTEAARHLGRPVDQILGHHLCEVVADNQVICDAVKGVLESGIAFEETITFTWADRPELGERTYNVTYAPDIDVTGTVVGVLTEGQDVTDVVRARRDAEDRAAELEALLAENRTQHQFLETLIRTLTVGVAVVSGDAQRFELVNRAFLTAPDPAVQDVVGRTVAEVFPGMRNLAEVKVWFETVIGTGEALAVRQHPFVLGPGRSAVYFDVDLVPLPDDRGKLARVLVVVHEVTEEVLARREVEAQRARLAAVLDQMPSGVVVAEAPAPGTVILTNAEGDRIWHSVREKDGGPSTSSGSRPEARLLDRALRTGEGVHGEEVAVVWEDGTEGVIQISAAPVRDATGQVTSAVAVMRDVTERRAMEAALRASELRYRRLFVGHRTPMLLIEPGTKQIVDANPAARDYYGYSREVLASMKAYDLNTLSEEEFERTVAAARNESHAFHAYQHRLASGEVRDVDIYVSPVQFEDRLLLHAIVHDVTERRRAEEALRQAHDQLDAVFSSIADGVLVFDGDGNAARVNPAAAAMMGFDPTQMALGDVLARLVLSDATGQVLQDQELPLGRALRGETLMGEDLVLQNAWGETLRLVVSAAPLWDGDLVGGAVVVWYDATERWQLTAQVAQRKAELEAIVSAIPDAVVVYGAEGQILQMNDRAWEVLGYTAEEAELPIRERVGLFTITASNGARVQPEQSAMLRALNGETVHGLVGAVRRESDERPTWLSSSAAPIRDADGSQWGAVATFADVTALYETQQRLEEANEKLAAHAVQLEALTAELQSQNRELQTMTAVAEAERAQQQTERARLEAILAALPVGVFIADAEGRLVEMNDRVYDVWGQGAVSTASAAEYGAYKGRWADSGEPLGAEDWALSRALREGRVVTGEMIDIERFDGLDATILNSAAPIRDRAGQIIGAVAVVQDVTGRRAMEAALAQRAQELEVLNRVNRALIGSSSLDEVLDVALEELRTLLGGTAASAWLLEGEPGAAPATSGLVCRREAGRYRKAVQGWRLAPGRSVAGWVVQHGEPLMVPDTRDDPRYVPEIDTEVGREMRSILAIPLLARSGITGVLQVLDERPGAFNAWQQSLASAVAAAAAVAVERAQLYEQAQKDADVRATLLREVNHRVKNNMSAILGLITAEQRRPEAAEDVRVCHILTDLANRVRSLVSVHGMLSAGGWQALPLSELVDQVIRSSTDAMNNGDSLFLDITPSPVMVTAAQAHHLALIVNELAINTLKYGGGAAGLVIDVRIEEEGGQVRVTFRDRGPGYPEAVVEGRERSIGMGLIETIVRLSLRGSWSIANEGGAVTEIRFPLDAGCDCNRGDAG